MAGLIARTFSHLCMNFFFSHQSSKDSPAVKLTDLHSIAYVDRYLYCSASYDLLRQRRQTYYIVDSYLDNVIKIKFRRYVGDVAGFGR